MGHDNNINSSVLRGGTWTTVRMSNVPATVRMSNSMGCGEKLKGKLRAGGK